MYRLSFIVLVLLFGCQQEAPQSAMALQESELQALATRIEAAFASQDAEALAALYAEDARLVNVLHHREEYEGRAAIKESGDGIFGAFPDGMIEITNTVASDNQLVIEAVFKATNLGALTTPDGEIPPTGKRIEMPYIFVLEVNDEGLIEEDRTYYDSAALMDVLTPDEEGA